MITVVVVDDSALMRDFLKEVLERDGRFRVVATAANGQEGVELVAAHRPDIVTMDIHMPVLDGFRATRAIMEQTPLPIVIVSSSFDAGEVTGTFQALQAGAVSVVAKPHGRGHPEEASECAAMIDTLVAMAEVKVVRRRPAKAAPAEAVLAAAPPVAAAPARRAGTPALVAIGASTGGPPALGRILAPLSAGYPLPIVVVQHISAGFLDGLVAWLATVCKLAVRIARDGEKLTPATVLFAPDGAHLEVTRAGQVRLTDEPPEYGTRPSVGRLFRSVAREYGARGVGVLLTGMGRDGALELRELLDRRGTTIVQDRESSVVWGMPGEAVRLGGAEFILTPEAISDKLLLLGHEVAGRPVPGSGRKG